MTQIKTTASSPALYPCVHGTSRWTNSHRARARHIANASDLPLCGERRKGTSYGRAEKDVATCAKCLKSAEGGTQ